MVNPNDVQEEALRLANRLRIERKRLGLTQVEFGALGGVKRSSQHLYEQGARMPDMNYLFRLKKCGVDVQFLIDGTLSGPKPLPKSAYLSAFRAVDEVARDQDGNASPLAERERLFDALITMRMNEHASATSDELGTV